MKATGIVRRIDDLGRVVIPKEIRKTLRIREGDPLEIYTGADGSVVFKKYSQLGDDVQLVKSLCEAVFKAMGWGCVIVDRENVVAVSGLQKPNLADKKITPSIQEIIHRRVPVELTPPEEIVEGEPNMANAIAPILAEGDIVGGVILINGEGQKAEVRVATLVAGILSKYFE